MAFFSTPGTERLYSGVTKSTRVGGADRAAEARPLAGGASASRSWL